MKKIRILGIDPGYAIVGFGVLDYDGVRFTPIEYGAVLTEAGTPFPERLRAIHEDIEFIFEKFRPDCMAVERLYFTTNQKTANTHHPTPLRSPSPSSPTALTAPTTMVATTST